MYIMVMFTLRVPMKVVDLQCAQTELEAVLLLPRPSSCSTISLLGENYRFSSKRFSFCLPCISWLVIQAAGLMGKLFLTHHSSMLGLAGGAMGSTDSSIPILWFWMHLPVKTRECQRERVPGRLSRLWQLTEGLSWIPHLSHTLWELQHIHRTKRSQSLLRWPPTVLGHGAEKEEESLHCKHWHFHYSLPIAPPMLCALVFQLLFSHVFSFGWVGNQTTLANSRPSQYGFAGWPFLFLRGALKTMLKWSPSSTILDGPTGSHYTS